MNTKVLYEYTKKIRVLYVEDEAEVRASVGTLFSAYFLDLVSAVDGFDALEKIKNSELLFDLVISDINMPNMNGIEMAREILLDNPAMPIIFITAYNDSQYLQEAIEIGVSSYLAKPLRKEQFDTAIFKASQIICDHKFVLSHMDLIEDLNLKLERQNKELQQKNEELEKSLRMLDTMLNKEQMIIGTPEDKEDPSETEIVDNTAFNLQVDQLVHEDLHELRELHMEIDTSVISIINKTLEVDEESLDVILKKFQKYASILAYHSFFSKLSAAMMNFVSTLQENPIPDSQEERENIFMLLESFLYVLVKWQNELESRNKEMINFFDASIINDMTTIINIWVKSPDEEEDFGDMEFF